MKKLFSFFVKALAIVGLIFIIHNAFTSYPSLKPYGQQAVRYLEQGREGIERLSGDSIRVEFGTKKVVDGDIYQDYYTWTKTDVVVSNSPVYLAEGELYHFGDDKIIQLLKGKFQVLKRPNTTPDGRIVQEIGYWDPARPLLVDFDRRASTPYGPEVYHPCAQRRDDGNGYNIGWILAEDAPRKSALPLAKWGKGDLRNNKEEHGRREIIDRMLVVLKRGQTSERLVYTATPWENGEKGSYIRLCYLRSLTDSTLIYDINGKRYVVTQDEQMNVDKYDERMQGRIMVQVTLAGDCAMEEVPVEFVYCRERI